MTHTDQQNVPTLRFPGFPGTWETAPISDWLAKVIDYRGKAPPKTETGVPLITARNVKMGYLDFEADEYIDSTLFKTWMNRGRPNPGDVMFTTEAPLGNVARYPEKGNYALGQRIITLQTAIDRCDSGFLFQTLLGPRLQRKIDARGTGSTAKGIKSRLFVKIPMSAPTLAEQRKIAGFLGAVDTKIAQLAEKKRLLEDYKKGCMQQLFSKKIRFKDEDGSDFPDWEEKRLAEVATKTASSISASSLDASPGEFPVYGASGISGYVNYFTSDDYHIGVVKDGAGVGRLYYCPPKSSVLGTLESVKASDQNITKFIFYWMFQINFDVYSTGSTIPHVYFKDYGKKRGHFPHPAEQRKISDFLSALDRKIELVCQKLEHARTFKHGLLQQMFV